MDKADKHYRTIVGAFVRDGILRITFANRDTIEINADAVLPKRAKCPIWKGVAVSSDGLYITIPCEGGSLLEIPWNEIRNLTDEDFTTQLAEEAARGATILGKKLKEPRERRKLTQRFVAKVIGVDSANLSRIENGSHDISSSTLLKLLSATGHSARDLDL